MTEHNPGAIKAQVHNEQDKQTLVIEHDLDDRYTPRLEMQQTLNAFKAEVKTALTRQTVLLVCGIAFLKSDIQLPEPVTVGAVLAAGVGLGWKLMAGVLTRG